MNSKYRDEQARGARQRDADNDAGPDPKGGEPPGEACRLLMECGKCQLLFATYYGDGVRCSFGLSGAERSNRGPLR